MQRYNPKNERIKKDYFRFLREADRKAETTIDGVRKAIARFEAYTGLKDFATFNKEQAIAFKRHLAKSRAERTGDLLSKPTLLSTINALKAFLKWLSCRPGYKSRIDVHHIEYLNLPDKDTRAAKGPKFKRHPTIEQIRAVVSSMPIASDIQRRNRALIAFTILTGMRDSAIASLRLKHVDIDCELVLQDPSEVRTKFSKRIDTFFFPVGDDLRQVVMSWLCELRDDKLYGNDDPVFPRTRVGQDGNSSFAVQGLEATSWCGTESIRKIFREAFANAGLPYFSPHCFRHTLVHLGEQMCRTPEQFKAWSQNLGHEQVLTTFTSYGSIGPHRQGEVIKSLGSPRESEGVLDEIRRLVGV